MSASKDPVITLDGTPHAAEADLVDCFTEIDGGADVVKQARASGISWPTIFNLLVQFGPQFVAFLRAVIAALNTPVPAPKA